ncbi:MAG: thiol reductant ABC exporter subunit CydC [Lachnospiraceae bacterium]
MRKRKTMVIMLKLIVLVRPMLPIMFLAVLAGVLGFLCASAITLLGGYALLEVFDVYTTGLGLTTLLVLAVAAGIGRGLLHYAEQAANHYIAFKLLATIRSKVFKALRRLAPAKLEGRNKGDLIALITSDVELLEVFYAHTISPIAIAILMVVLMVLYIGQFHWILGAVALGAYLLVGAVIPIINSVFVNAPGHKQRTSFAALSSFILDSLRGLPEILQYGVGALRMQQMAERTGQLQMHQQKLKKHEAHTRGFTDAAILLAAIAMLFTCLYLNSRGELAPEAILLAVIALMGSFGPVTALSNLSNNLALTLSSGDRVLQILEEEPETEEVRQGADVVFEGAACENISFSYQEETILRDISLQIQPGKIIGITGKSGSGKSTLLKLLMRFWDTDRGSVTISQEDIRHINTSALRTMESYVTQETQLFDESIEENIRIARLSATDEEVAEAARKASLHDFITTLPDGYKTNVGELGDNLSGGERQRIGIARAFLSNARLMLLDEPTSNLDSLNEGVILKSVRKEKEDRTVVLVSHRESTMQLADYSYSVENGRLS